MPPNQPPQQPYQPVPPPPVNPGMPLTGPAPLPPQGATPPVASGPREQAAERLKQANTVMVTVSASPTVDQLAACIGMTLLLNKAGKHATAVFSGQVPSTIEFLQPEKTIETTTDSLQDFIISLDKSKADKLRYKVENDVVKIFITPYRTSLSQKDLEFSQGDFNVEVVLALGVTKREDLDKVILAHGRILHDATVISMTKGQQRSEMGAINWQEPNSSSLSEMAVLLTSVFQPGLIDNQIATAFLTGIVAETERFSNQRTTPLVMSMSAQLMAAGANQQLIANKLQQQVEAQIKPQPKPVAAPEPPKQPEAQALPVQEEPNNDGTLSIDHTDDNREIIIDEAGRLERLRRQELGLPDILPAPSEGTEPVAEENPPITEPPVEPEPAPQPEMSSEPPEQPSLPEPPEQTEDQDYQQKKEEPPEEPPTEPEEPAPEPPPKDEKEPSDEGQKSGDTTGPEIRGHSLLRGDAPDVGLTANTTPEHQQDEPTSDPMSNKESHDTPILSHRSQSARKTIDPLKTDDNFAQAVAVEEGEALPPPAKPAADSLADIESSIGTAQAPEPTNTVDEARNAVQQAADSLPPTYLPPVQGLNAQELGRPQPPVEPAKPEIVDPTAPPPVPPPMMPQFFDPTGKSDNPLLNPDGTQK